jgi:restriction system protein
VSRRRTRQSGFEQVIEAFARLPWRWCLALAPISYFGFNQLAQIAPPEALTTEGLGSVVGVQAMRAAGMLLQYIALLILIVAALISWLGQRRRQLLSEIETRTSRAPLRHWQSLLWRSSYPRCRGTLPAD